MKKLFSRRTAIIIGIISLLALPAVAADWNNTTNNTIELTDIMGNPLDMIKPMLDEVKWLFGTVYGGELLAVLLCIAVAVIKAAYGSLTANPVAKQEGKSAAIEIVAIVFIGVVATGIIIFLFNTFIFK